MLMKHRFAVLVRRGFLGLMLLGSAWITLASVEYFDAETMAPFVIEKLPVRFEALWLASLQVHVASAVLSFPLCLLAMTRWLQRRRAWHRWLGRVAGVGVLAALVPSGVVLAFDAKGGLLVTTGFLVSAAIVAAAMVRGVVSARRGALVSHARCMRHVVAQMSVAVTSRAMLMAFDFASVDPDLAYVVALWVPVVGSAAAAEWASGQSLFTFFNFVQPVHRSSP